jgi:hypothetical protein
MPESNTNTDTTYHPRVLHSDGYYTAVLNTLIYGVSTKKTDKEIATLLNDKGLLSPRGQKWSPSAVKQALYKIRNFREIPTTLHRVLMQLCFSQVISGADALVLFEPRRRQVM